MRQSSSTSGSRVRRLTQSALFMAGLAILLGVAHFVFLPRHDRDQLWTTYRALPRDSVQVLFIGTSLIHANVNPVMIWEDSGIRSYALSGSEQSLPTTLEYLRQALCTQTPDVVVLDLQMLSLDNAILRENQKRANFTMMPLGLPKIRGVISGSPAGEWTGYLIPLEQFHSRWSELTRADFDPHKWSTLSANMFLGYRMTHRIEPQQPTTDRRALDEDVYAHNYRYISEICQLAEYAGAEVLLLVGPSSRVNVHDEWIERLDRDMARDHPGAELLQSQLSTQTIGLDYATDYYDQWHLNTTGAEKYSVWLGRELAGSYTLSHPQLDTDLDAMWRAELIRYRQALEDQ
ncbi:MAG: hypothetical protein JXR33_07180 [Coriobacteriia bacterium]|nr:hypothetical protein [Coriobacteriia bacterium]